MAVIIDEQNIKELLERGVENIYPNREFLEERLKSGEQLTLYTGYDPTAPTLHVGHGITMMKLKQFQDLGHKVIMLIGDFTGMIGDPTDKLSTRKKLTKEEVLKNCQEYQKQASAILNFEGENAVEVKYNSEWLSKMNFADVVELCSHFTVPRLLERDMFQERLKEGKTVYLHEFLYPIMQGYDCVAMDVDGEVGGNDQTFNMLAGRTLMKELKNKEKFVLTMKLLTDNSGKKMGKSEGNMIAFSDTPEDMFGKVMSWTDGMILPAFELCTFVSMEEIEEMKKEMDEGGNPRDFKLKLAYEIVRIFLGKEEAEKGKMHFANVIQNKDLSSKSENIEVWEVELTKQRPLEILTASGLCKTRGESRAIVRGGGMWINEERVEDESKVYDLKDGDIIKKGRHYKKVSITASEKD